MPLLNEDAMAKLMRAELRDNIFVLFGDDDYLKEFYCEKLIKKAVPDTLRTFNLHVYNDEDTPLYDVFADAQTLPMMNEYTCLLVRNYPLNKLGSQQLKEFEDELKDVPVSTILIFYFNTLDVSYNKKNNVKWCAVLDVLMKYGKVVQLDHRSPQKIAQMLISGAPKRGTTIDRETALYFINAVGEDIQTLINEFNKVCAYADHKPVTTAMIDEVSVKTTEAQVFDVSTAILNRDTDKAFAAVHELLNKKTSVQSVIGALASTYVNIYRYKVAKTEDKGVADLRRMFTYKNTFVLNDIPALSSKISLKGVRYCIDELLEADVITKSRSYDSYTLMTELIAKLGAGALM